MYMCVCMCVYLCMYVSQAIDLMSRVFGNGPSNWGSIPGRVIPKDPKKFLMPPCLTLSIIRCGSKGKVEPSRKWSRSFPTLWCSSY